jgi:hypothetical protein
MAVGLQGSFGAVFVIRLLEAATATNSPPATYAGAGVDIGAILDERYGAYGWPSSCGLLVHTSAGSATMTATVKLWAGVLGVGTAGAGKYVAASPGSAALSGLLNGGAAFDEHATDVIHRLDVIALPRLAQKMYAEITAIGGTSTAVTVDLIFGAAVPS